jgi:hypothetical protein
LDAIEEEIGEEWFEAEFDAESLILVFCLGQAADDEHGNGRREGAQAGYEFRASHAGHEVVGDDEIDVGGVFVVAKLVESAFGIENGDDKVAGPLKDGLTRRGLDGIVVNEK